ncbi:E3 ubiquitin-protein ligase CCNB1IP1 [Castilleja foliolosa]|uniref:E3 ubiquitin-protein ligase CCNB1IP1 n=1 Tax=Castilleja foliolosa TaxID=1961234 RepID=A0ABD3CNE3_9LAMI
MRYPLPEQKPVVWDGLEICRAKMRCNACWRELEGRAITTTCGHLLCPEDANKILSCDGACPICDQVLSKSHMKPVDINPNDEWVNVAMAGISPQILMKSAYRSVTFYIGQRDLEMQVKMSKIVAQCRQKCEAMQEKFTEKLEQVYTAYQKMTKRCEMMEKETESLLKDKQELQEKYAEKCRQKRKLDEMYDQASTEIESMKRMAIQPANHRFSRQDPDDMFSNPSDKMDNINISMRKDWSVFTPDTPGPREDMWPARQNSDCTFDLNDTGNRGAKQSAVPIDIGNRGAHSTFGAGSGVGARDPSMTLRNLLITPIKRPQLSRSRPQLFTRVWNMSVGDYLENLVMMMISEFIPNSLDKTRNARCKIKIGSDAFIEDFHNRLRGKQASLANWK